MRDLGILGRRPRVSLEVKPLWMLFGTSDVCVGTRLRDFVQYYFLLPFEIFINSLNCPGSYLFLFRPSQFFISSFSTTNFNNRQISNVRLLSGERRSKAA